MGTKIWATGWPDLINQEAITDQECDMVFETRRQAYSRNTDYSGVAVRDAFDRAPNTFSCLLIHRRDLDRYSRMVGTIRLSLRGLEQDPLSTPCSRIFGPEIKRLYADRRFVEVSRLAIRPSRYGDTFRLYLALMQNVVRAADEHDSDLILAPTIAEHTRVYIGMGFEQITEARQYHGGIVCCLLALDWRSKRSVLLKHRRFYRLFADWSGNELAA